MRKLSTVLVLIPALAIPLPASYAQRKNQPAKAAPASIASQRGVDTITAAELKDYLSFIASDEMEGRDTPSRGLDTTAKFLAMNLSRWGFKPAGDNGSFFQRIELIRNRTDGAQSRVEFNGQLMTAGDDYIPVSGSGNISGQIVFAGNGWFVKSKNL